MSTRGNSVVDYCIVPYEHIGCYEGFKVIRPTQIYGDNSNGVESRLTPAHSIITCSFILNRFQIEIDPKLHHDFLEKRFTRYNVLDIPPNFCSDENSVQLPQALSDPEGQMQTQNDIDKIYDDFCTVVKNVDKTTKKSILLSIALGINIDGFVNPGGMMIYSVYGMKCVVQKNHGYDLKSVKNSILNTFLFKGENCLTSECNVVNGIVGLIFKMKWYKVLKTIPISSGKQSVE